MTVPVIGVNHSRPFREELLVLSQAQDRYVTGRDLMTAETHSQIASFIWSICNLLRGPYKRNEYRKVILPLTVLRRFDCLLESTKEKVLDEHQKLKGKSDTIVRHALTQVIGRDFYNLSRLDMGKLLDDPNQLAPNLNGYINGFSPNVRSIMERFKFGQEISKMRPTKEGGSRVGIVFNGSPLFTGDAGGGESSIRQWIIENDWLEAIVALPEQLFYNTGISTYIWILTNKKEKTRKEKVQLIDARNHWLPMKKSLGNKRRKIGDREEGERDDISAITKLHGNFCNDETRSFLIDGKNKELVVSKIFDNDDFGYRKVTVERPLRLNFQASEARIAGFEEESGFKNVAASSKKADKARLAEIEDGQKRQAELRKFLSELRKQTSEKLFKNRVEFLEQLKEVERKLDIRTSAAEQKFILSALSDRDETAEICCNKSGEPEADSELRDTETIPLKVDIHEYFKREVAA